MTSEKGMRFLTRYYSAPWYKRLIARVLLAEISLRLLMLNRAKKRIA